MARPPHPLRQVFETALLAHIKARGDDFEKSPLVQDFVDRGVGQATVYRWIDAVVARRRISPSRNAAWSPAGAEPLAMPSAPAEERSPVLIAKALPRVPTIKDAKSQGLVPVLELLRHCIDTAQSLIQHAKAPDGGVRNARLMNQGAESLRRAIETAAKINETVGLQREMQQFHEIVMEEISAEAPEVQVRILTRIQRVADAELAH